MHASRVIFYPSASYDEALARAASFWGIEREYWDVWSQRHEASAEVKRRILATLNVNTDSKESLDAAVEERLWTEWSRFLPAALVVSEHTSEVVAAFPAALAHESVSVSIRWEDGTSEQRRLELPKLADVGWAELRGKQFVKKRLMLPPLRLGYHELEVSIANHAIGLSIATSRLTVCPDRAWCPPELESGGRTAGIAVSLYGLRSARNWGCGDFTDLRALIDWAAEDAGVGFIALNPLHAIPNRQPFNTSPYLPACTFYRNLLYVDIEQVPDFQKSPWARRLAASPPVRTEIEALRGAEFVEYERVNRLKLKFLKIAFRQFLAEYRAETPRAMEFRRWEECEGELLNDYAVYCALDEWVHQRSPNVWLWTEWPEPYRDPHSEQTRAFAREHWRSVLFYKYVQWQLDLQLAATQEYAHTRGLPIGLYHDLALATDRFGSDLWAHRPFYVAGCRVGSPPDSFSPKGQDWSFPPPNSMRHREDGYRLFAASIRKNCRHGGALRIDHVMRFFRLFWIPDGMEAIDGTYVLDRPEDLLHILALESVRQKIVIVGEDLGTVTDQVREMLAQFGILSYRLFYFEKHWKDGSFKRPEEYPRQALVAATTHDLPTLAGFWLGRDIEARRRAGLLPDEGNYRRQLAERAIAKQKMLDALFELGLLPDWFPRLEGQIPEFTGELHYAAVGFLASAPSMLMLMNQEDLAKETEQQNLPGTTAEYPNWRRKMRFSVEELRTSPAARDLTAMFRHWLEKTGRLNRVTERAEASANPENR